MFYLRNKLHVYLFFANIIMMHWNNISDKEFIFFMQDFSMFVNSYYDNKTADYRKKLTYD